MHTQPTSALLNITAPSQRPVNRLLLQRVHTADTDKTKLSCVVPVGGVNTTGDKTKQICLEQLQIGIWIETRQKNQNCLVLSPILFTLPTRNCLVLSAVVFTPRKRTRQDKTRQFCLIRVGGVNKLLGAPKLRSSSSNKTRNSLRAFILFGCYDNVRECS